MRKIIRTDGTEQDLQEPVSMAQIYALIGAQTIDTVNLRHLGRPLHVMCVDDNGYETTTKSETTKEGFRMEIVPTRARKPVNQKATELYWANCVPGTTHQIVGDVVIVPDDDFA